MPAKDILKHVPGYPRNVSKKTVSRRRALLEHPLVSPSYETSSRGKLASIVSDLQAAGYAASLSSVRHDLHLYRNMHLYLTLPELRPKLEERAESQSGAGGTDVYGVRLLMEAGITSYNELGVEPHGEATEAETEEELSAPHAPAELGPSAMNELGTLVRLGQAAYEALELIAAFERERGELNERLEQADARLCCLEEELQALRQESAGLREERDALWSASREHEERVSQLRALLGSNNAPSPPRPAERPRPSPGPGVRKLIDALPQRAGVWAGGADVHPSQLFVREALALEPSLRKRTVKAVCKLALDGPGSSGLTTRTPKRKYADLPDGVRVSRISREWRLVWTLSKKMLTLYAVRHHTGLWRSEGGR